MTIDNVIFLCAGVCVNGLTFALGIAVGLTFRKDSDHDCDNDEDEEGSKQWHLPLDIGRAHSPGLRTAGGAGAKPEANLAKRPTR